MFTINGLENLLDKIRFSAGDMEKQIAGYTLTFLHERVPKVEYRINLPIFVYPFYKYVVEKQETPTPEEYLRRYVDENREYLVNLNLTKEEKLGVKARVYRTYPSLVRDLNCALLIKEKQLFKEVYYNDRVDVEYGIDLVVVNEKPVGLNLYTDTKNAHNARLLKQYRPKKPVNFGSIKIPLAFRGSKECGDFFLYSDREIAYIVQKIQITGSPAKLADEPVTVHNQKR